MFKVVSSPFSSYIFTTNYVWSFFYMMSANDSFTIGSSKNSLLFSQLLKMSFLFEKIEFTD